MRKGPRPTMLSGVLALLPVLAANAAFAQSPEGFRSPSSNIHCQYFAEEQTLRCDVMQISNRPLPRPRDCDLEWGQAFEMRARNRDAGPICYGDTIMDNRLPVLDYGERWQRGDLVCHSERSGVSCQNSLGAGFVLSRGAQTVLRGGAGGR